MITNWAEVEWNRGFLLGLRHLLSQQARGKFRNIGLQAAYEAIWSSPVLSGPWGCPATASECCRDSADTILRCIDFEADAVRFTPVRNYLQAEGLKAKKFLVFCLTLESASL
jgi:hypothetical protein